MPNGHDYSKQYGPHEYDKDHCRTSDCAYKCGCWMGPSRSGGPIGVDPFGECPKNPNNGKLLEGNIDQEIVVTRRIRRLEYDAYESKARADKLEKINGAEKIQLYRDLESANQEIERLRNLLKEINEKSLKISPD